jgi:hypothetical protein
VKERVDNLGRYGSGQPESALLNLNQTDDLVQHLKATSTNERNYIVLAALRANVYYDHATLYPQVFVVLPFEVSEPWEVKAGRYSSQTPRRA